MSADHLAQVERELRAAMEAARKAGYRIEPDPQGLRWDGQEGKWIPFSFSLQPTCDPLGAYVLTHQLAPEPQALLGRTRTTDPLWLATVARALALDLADARAIAAGFAAADAERCERWYTPRRAERWAERWYALGARLLAATIFGRHQARRRQLRAADGALIGWRWWWYHYREDCLESPVRRGVLWVGPSLTAERWSDSDAVADRAGIHAVYDPRSLARRLCFSWRGFVHGRVRGYGRYVLGTEGWRAERVVVDRLVIMNGDDRAIIPALEARYQCRATFRARPYC